MQVNAAVLGMKSGPGKSYLYGLIGQLAANPRWFSWSFTDEELRDLFETNKALASATSILGVLVLGKSGAAILEHLLKISEVGLKNAIKETVVSTTKAKVARDIASKLTTNPKVLNGSSYAAAYVIVLSTFLWYCSSRTETAARNELVLRGLIRLEEL